MKKNGFTLIELMIVIAIIALLAAVALPKFSTVTDDAKAANVRANLSSIRTSISMFNAKIGGYPILGAGANGIAANGNLGLNMQTYYSKTQLAQTPGVTSSSGIAIVASRAVTTPANGTDNGGWTYNATNGEFHADFAANVLGVADWDVE